MLQGLTYKVVVSVLLTSTVVYLPEAQGNWRLTAQTIVGGLIVLGGFFLLVTSKDRIQLIIRVLRASGGWWLFMGSLLITQAVDIGRQPSFQQITKLLGYLLVFPTVYLIYGSIGMRLSDRIWSAVGAALVVPSAIGILGSYGYLSVGVYKEKIPLLNVPSTQSVFFDPNYFALVALVGVVCAARGYKTRGLGLKRAPWILTIIVHLMAILVSWSRASYIAVFVGLLVWIASDNIPVRKKLIWLGILAGLESVFLTWAVTSAVGQELLELRKGLTGRENLWALALGAIGEKPLTGWGLGHIDEIFESVRWVSSHNTFLDFGIMTGIVGMATLVYLIGSTIVSLAMRADTTVDRQFLLTLIVVLSLVAEFIVFIPGAVDFGSVVLTMALGQANAIRLRGGSVWWQRRSRRDRGEQNEGKWAHSGYTPLELGTMDKGVF